MTVALVQAHFFRVCENMSQPKMVACVLLLCESRFAGLRKKKVATNTQTNLKQKKTHCIAHLIWFETKGHVTYTALPNIIRVLKPGAKFAFTVRKTFYDEFANEWNDYLQNMKECKFINKHEIPYMKGVTCYVITLQKN